MSDSQPPQRPAAFITLPPKRVLFLCVHNSARSQMAEEFARAMAPEGVRVWSAGTAPGEIHPLARQVMSEVGIDLGPQSSISVDDVPWREADAIVTLYAEEACPAVSTEVRRVSWPMPDPAAVPEPERLQASREVRDEIRWRVSSPWPRSA